MTVRNGKEVLETLIYRLSMDYQKNSRKNGEVEKVSPIERYIPTQPIWNHHRYRLKNGC